MRNRQKIFIAPDEVRLKMLHQKVGMGQSDKINISYFWKRVYNIVRICTLLKCYGNFSRKKHETALIKKNTGRDYCDESEI